MDLGKKVKRIQKELRQQKLPESKICEAIPAFYEDKCGKFLYPMIPFNNPKWKRNPIPKSKHPQGCGSPSRGSWTYKKFESKLASGILTIPGLNLDQVPKSIFTFVPPLRIVYLNDNQLTGLPHDFFDDLPQLAWLDLRHNKVRYLPEISKPHPALRTLLIQNNQLTRLPLTLHFAEQLSTIGLRGNPIVDPPSNVVQEGTLGILKYLADRFQNPDIPEDTSSDGDVDEAVTLLAPKHLRIKEARNVTDSQLSLDADQLPKTRLLRMLYSDALWRHAEHKGPNKFDILVKSQQEMKNNIQRKLEVQKESILQRMRDSQAREKFRAVARHMQVNGVASRKAETYGGVKPPFGSVKDEKGEGQPRILGIEDFHKEFLENWDRLKTLTSNPVPIEDFERTKKRLKEVEEIQQNISNMKLSMKIPI